MTQGDALLRAVLAEPHDDEPRLIYADYLEESGEADRAEFIRIQMETAKPLHCEWRTRGLACEAYNADVVPYRVIVWCPACKARRLALGRESQMMNDPRCRWWNPYGPGDVVTVLEWRRGFVERIACSESDFLRHAEVIFRCQPVTSVVLWDRTPYVPKQNLAEWSRRERDEQAELGAYLHPDLYSLLPASDGEDWATTGGVEMANLWLSHACVAYGRERAGLPALEVPAWA